MSASDFPGVKPVPERSGDSDLVGPTDRPRHLRDFANLSNESFIEAAYGAVLHRRSDPGGRACYLGLLDQGMSRAEILICLIESPEGRSVGSRIDGLSFASRWGRMRRMRIIAKAIDIGKRMWPLTTVRSDLEKLTQKLELIEELARSINEESKQRHRDVVHQLNRVQSEMSAELAKRASTQDLVSLETALVGLSGRVAEVSRVNESKADESALGRIHEDMRVNLYRGLDDLDRRVRILLDAKADADTVTESAAAFEKRLQDTQQNIESRIQSVDARKADLSAIEETRAEMLAGRTSIADIQANFRALLDAKAGTDTMAEMVLSFEARLHALQQEVQAFQRDLEIQIKCLDAQKADASAIGATRAEMLTALRAALTSLTGSVSSVAANKIDRATLNGLLAENSQTLLRHIQESVLELRSSIGELSARQPLSRGAKRSKRPAGDR